MAEWSLVELRTGYASKWQCLLPKERKFPRRIFLPFEWGVFLSVWSDKWEQVPEKNTSLSQVGNFFYQCDLTNESKFPSRIFLPLKLGAFLPVWSDKWEQVPEQNIYSSQVGSFSTSVIWQIRASSRKEYFFLSSWELFHQCDLTNESKFPRRIFLLLKLEAFSINLLKRLSYPIMEASGDLHLHHKMDEPSAMVERGGGE